MRKTQKEIYPALAVLMAALLFVSAFCAGGFAAMAAQDFPPELLTEEISTEESPTEETPTEETPTEETPIEESPTEETPTEEIPTEEIPTEGLLIEEVSVDEQNTANFECADYAQFAALLLDGSVTTITLTDNIFIKGYGNYLRVYEPTTVIMGDNSIIIEEDCYVSLTGPLSFSGSGILFDVYGQVGSGPGVSIAAQGDNSVGILIQETGTWDCSLNYTRVSASGAGAMAVQALGDCSVRCLRISAYGQNAVGVQANGNINTFLCHISASGGAQAALSSEGSIILDCSFAAPYPDDAETIRRKAYINEETAPLFLFDFGSHISLPEEYDVFFEKNANDNFAYKLAYPMLVSWENVPQNCAVPGSWQLHLVFDPCYADLPIDGMEECFTWLYIVDPNKPFIKDVGLYFTMLGPNGFFVEYYREIEGAESIRLFYAFSPEGPWLEFDPEEHKIGVEYSILRTLEIGRLYYLQVRVEGGPMAGESNIYPFRYGELGGDRDGTGQGDQGGLDPPKEGGTLPGGENPPEEGGTLPGGEDSATEDNLSAGLGVGKSILPQPRSTFTQDYTAEPVKEAVATELIEPAPIPLAAPNAQPVAPTEPEWNITLSARQLADIQAARPQYLTFIENGVKLVIPSALLYNLRLEENEYFTAALSLLDSNRFAVYFQAGGRDIDGFADGYFAAYIPYDLLGGDWRQAHCLDSPGNIIPASGWEDGKLLFDLNTTGIFTIMEETMKESSALITGVSGPAGLALPPAAVSGAEAPPRTASGALWLLLPGASIAAIWGYILYLRKKVLHNGPTH